MFSSRSLYLRFKPGLSLFLILMVLSIPAFSKEKKAAQAIRIKISPEIDGKLDEDVWNHVPSLTDFLQWNPHNGQPASQRTEVKICYDDRAIYIGAICYDDSPEKIMKEIRFRDDITGMNADEFAVNICPFNDSLNSYFLGVTVANVQRDVKFSGDEADKAWDAVWESRVCMTEAGWILEIKIPFSAVRFSSDSVQDWGINFWRWIARNREWDIWSFVDVSIEGWWKQNGILQGLKDLDPPLHLSLYPYISGYSQKGLSGDWGFSYNGGTDLKYGITDSFTLDVTLIPDFGQVQSDDELLNLTPYEIKYNERRQFFTEGTELFNKGDVFYTRRIGARPVGYDSLDDQLYTNESVIKNPNETRLINATKMSGRTNSGLGIGILNAMTSSSQALVMNTLIGEEREIQTQPFTNYNIFVLDQTLFSNSYISLINTNVFWKGYLANVTATEFTFADRSNTYRLKGIGAVSHIKDAGVGITGFKALMKAGKFGGQFQYEYNLSIISDHFDQNDLGYLKRNNEAVQQLSFEYNIYEPFSIFRGLTNRIDLIYNRMYTPNAFSEFIIRYKMHASFKNHYFLDLELGLAPGERNDYYETRTSERYFVNHKFYEGKIIAQTDARKPFSMGLQAGFMNSFSYDFNVSSWQAGITPNLRPNNQINLGLGILFTKDKNQTGFVHKDLDTGEIFFGKRDRKTLENTAQASYVLNNRMSLIFRARHYWSLVEHDSYFKLLEDGRLGTTGYDTNHDVNFNAFNIDMTFRWNFAPGSEISVNWKNSIYTSDSRLVHFYWDNLRNSLDSPQINSLSIKILYYFDRLFK